MSLLVAALDNTNNKQLGENIHIEYSWESKNIHELLVKLYFQLVRCKEEELEDLKNKFNIILKKCYSDKKKYQTELIMLYKIVANTRDITDGKGEYKLSFMMLYEWYLVDNKAAFYLFERFLTNPEKIEHQLGSWKDAKNFIYYLIKEKNVPGMSDDFVNYIVNLFNHYLKKEWKHFQYFKNPTLLSLIGKWAPREKSKHGWFHQMLAYNYFPEYLETAKNPNSLKKAQLKCKIEFTKIITTLNKYLDTTQVKQCSGNYKYIDFNKVTSLTMRKQRNAFLGENLKKKGKELNEDRRECSKNLKNHINEMKKPNSNKKIHGKRCNVYELVKDAVYEENEDLKNIINLQWEDNKKNNPINFGNLIPMVDTSGSMEMDECIPLYNAIGLGIRISENNNEIFKNRILTFDQSPSWIKLENTMSFCDKVKKVKDSAWGMSTNFYKAANLILEVLIQEQIHPDSVKDLTFVILSDMQINSAENNDNNLNTLYDELKKLFTAAGLQTIHQKPYEVPHILFWNLRKTIGFPNLSDELNTTMLSGYSSYLMNVICNKGYEELKKVTPYSQLTDILSNKRYLKFEKWMRSNI
jgi:hypothetical protein